MYKINNKYPNLDYRLLEEIIIYAAQKISEFIYNKLNEISFPENYKPWVAVKLAKSFNDFLKNNNLKELTPYTFADTENKLPEKEQEARSKFEEYFNSTWLDKIYSIRDWISSNRQETQRSFKNVIKDFRRIDELQLEKAYDLSVQWHNELDKVENNKEEKKQEVEKEDDAEKEALKHGYEVVKKYENGLYWVDLKSNKCEEGEFVIACGHDPQADTIISLKKPYTQAVVAVSIKYGKKINYYIQAKGKGNKKPDEKYFPYIEDLFSIKNISAKVDSYASDEDFQVEDISNEDIKERFEESKKEIERIYDLNRALYNAAENNNIEMVKFSIENGADDLNGALYNASRNNNIEIVKYLIEKGADDLNRALDNAARNNNIEMVKFLVENGADDLNYALPFASRNNNIEMVKFLVENGADDLNRALDNAARNNNIEMVKFLVENGADDLNYALEFASRNNNIEIVKFLVENGADDLNGALYNASRNNNIEIVKFLKQEIKK